MAGEHAGTIVDRSQEIRELAGAIDGVAGGTGRVIALTGPSGIGKSVVLDRALGGVDDRFRVLSTRSRPIDADRPHGVIRALLGPALSALDAEELAEAGAGVASVAVELLSSGDGRFTTSESLDHSLYWLVANLADRRPLVLAIDDAHWADGASLRSLVHLARRASDLPLALVLVARVEEAKAQRSLLERLMAEADDTLRLGPLSADGAAVLVRERLAAADPAFAEACHRLTGGNPFLLGELIYSSSQLGIDPTPESAEQLQRLGPASVAENVLGRIQAFDPDAEALVQVLAVLGDAHGLAVASEIAELDSQASIEAAAALQRLRVLDQVNPAAFAHTMVRNAIYDSMSEDERAAAHANVARRLHALDADEDTVASHLLLSGPSGDQDVVSRLRGAGQRAFQRGAPESAVSYMRRAAAEPPGTDELAQVLFELGLFEMHSGDPAAVATLERALQAASEVDLRMTIAPALSVSYALARRYDRTVALQDQIEAELVDQPERLERRLVGRGSNLYYDYDDAQRLIGMVAGLRSDGAKPAHARRVEALKAWAAVAEGDVAAEDALAHARAALESGTLGRENEAAPYFELAAWALAFSGDPEGANQVFDVELDRLLRAGRARRAGTLLGPAARVSLLCGRVPQALERSRRGLELLQPEEMVWEVALNTLVCALTEAGDLDEAEQLLVAHGFDREIPEGGQYFAIYGSRGALRLRTGDVERGLADVLSYGRALRRMRRVNPAISPWRSLAALAMDHLGRTEEARRLAAEELELALRFGATGPVGIAQRTIALMGPAAERVVALEQAAETLADSELPTELLRTRIAIGAALREAGEIDAAIAVLREALDGAERQGAGALASDAAEQLRAMGLRPRRSAISGLEALTPSELRVVELAREGSSNSEIAQALFVTKKTVEQHLSHAYKKLGIASRREL